MSKSGLFENKAFSTPSNIGFNLVPQVNNFNSFFGTQPLDEKEDKAIQHLLHQNTIPEKSDRLEKDYLELKTLASEIRAIGRQGTLLTGERVARARVILLDYKEGAFTDWLNVTFGSRKTAYNALRYFELYEALAIDLKEKFKKMPLKSAYALASRDAELSQKQEIVRDYHDYDCKTLISLIQDKMPSSEPPIFKKTLIEKLISELEDIVKKLEKEKGSFTEGNRITISCLKSSIDSLFS